MHMKKTEYRFDVAIILIIPIMLSCIIVKLCPFIAINNSLHYAIRTAVIIIACIFECINMKELINEKSKDKGIISALFISISISLVNILSNVGNYEIITKISIQNGFIICGLCLALVGILIRYKARRDLNTYFSHTVQIVNNHKLITNGIYQYIRHPAYVGTFLIFIGLFLMYYTVFFVPFIILGLVFGIKRVESEEKMLINYFGNEYIKYSKNVGRFLPNIGGKNAKK